MLGSGAANVVCRQIERRDIDGVIDCLARNFPERTPEFWRNALTVLSERPTIDDYPQFGQCLEINGRIVGVLLLIHSRRDAAGPNAVRCNTSSWCVDPEFRSYSMVLHKRAIRRPEVTYVNASSAAHTRPFVEAMGFRRFSDGRLLFAPLLSTPRNGARVVEFAPQSAAAQALSPHLRTLLADHVAFGCRSMIGLRNGEAHGFVFCPRKILGGRVTALQLIYCEDIATLPLFAHAIGRRLARSGVLLIATDANGPIKGLVGRYSADHGVRYAMGPVKAPLGDLAYSETALLGV